MFVWSNRNYCYNRLNWIYLYDAYVFFRFRFWFGFYNSFPLRISPVIHIFQKLDTLSIGEEFVRSNGKYCYHPLNWIYLYDADVFFQFSILIRILELISGPNQSRHSYIIQKIGYFVHRRRVCKEQWELLLPPTKLDISLWCICFLSLSILIRIIYLISAPNQSSDSYFSKIGYFVLRRRVCKEQWELLLPSNKSDISLWCRCFLSIFDYDSDSRPHFRSESVQLLVY